MVYSSGSFVHFHLSTVQFFEWQEDNRKITYTSNTALLYSHNDTDGLLRAHIGQMIYGVEESAENSFLSPSQTSINCSLPRLRSYISLLYLKLRCEFVPLNLEGNTIAWGWKHANVEGCDVFSAFIAPRSCGSHAMLAFSSVVHRWVLQCVYPSD